MLWKTEATIFIRMIARAFMQRKQPYIVNNRYVYFLKQIHLQ